MPKYIVAFPKETTRSIEIGKVIGGILSLDESLSRIGKHLCIIFEHDYQKDVSCPDPLYVPRQIHYGANIVDGAKMGDQIVFAFDSPIIATEIYSALRKWYANYAIHYPEPEPFLVKIDSTDPRVVNMGCVSSEIVTYDEYYILPDTDADSTNSTDTDSVDTLVTGDHDTTFESE